MPEKIGYGGSVVVTGGPRVAFTRQLEVDGYDKFHVTVADTKKVKVNVGADTSKVVLLVITASQYSSGATTLTFGVDGGASQLLEEPVFVAGLAAVKALGKFETMEFENKLGADATVEVFLARDPTP